MLEFIRWKKLQMRTFATHAVLRDEFEFLIFPFKF